MHVCRYREHHYRTPDVYGECVFTAKLIIGPLSGDCEISISLQPIPPAPHLALGWAQDTDRRVDTTHKEDEEGFRVGWILVASSLLTE